MADHFYAEVKHQSKSAFLLLTSDYTWKLAFEDSGMNFEKNAGRGGKFTYPASSVSQYYFYKDGAKEESFRVSGVRFPPSIIMQPKFLDNQFHIGEAWAKALGYKTPHDATMANEGHWYPVATGALMSWIQQYCDELTLELKRPAAVLGLNVAAIFDPTGTLSLGIASNWTRLQQFHEANGGGEFRFKAGN